MALGASWNRDSMKNKYMYIHYNQPTKHMKSRTFRKSSSSRKFRKSSSSRKFRKSQKTCKSRIVVQRGGYPKPSFCPKCGSDASYLRRNQGSAYGTDDWYCNWCEHEWTFNPDWTFKRGSRR